MQVETSDPQHWKHGLGIGVVGTMLSRDPRVGVVVGVASWLLMRRYGHPWESEEEAVHATTMLEAWAAERPYRNNDPSRGPVTY